MAWVVMDIPDVERSDVVEIPGGDICLAGGTKAQPPQALHVGQLQHDEVLNVTIQLQLCQVLELHQWANAWHCSSPHTRASLLVKCVLATVHTHVPTTLNSILLALTKGESHLHRVGNTSLG